MRPWRATVVSARRCISARLDISARAYSARPGNFATTSLPSASSMSARTTRAPSPVKTSTTLAPMPREPPMTIATRSLNLPATATPGLDDTHRRRVFALHQPRQRVERLFHARLT